MEYHRVWRFSYGLVLLLLYASLVSAGNALTLKEVTQIALANNKDLKAALTMYLSQKPGCYKQAFGLIQA